MDPVRKIAEIFYWPICRAYSRYLGDRPADATLRFLCGLEYWRVYRFWPKFVSPQRFTEKVWSRMLHNRDPLLTLISDKLRIREYVSQKIGSDNLIPLLWSGENPEEIPFEELPMSFVIKANHGCDYNIIVIDKKQLNLPETKSQLKKWLRENFGRDKFLGISWGYKNVKPRIIVEAYIGDKKAPLDYKFYCFAGRFEFFKIDFDRFEAHSEKFFDRDLNKLDLFEKGLRQYHGKIELPHNFNDMVRVAESLAKGFNFIRVDLYSIGGKIFFSELTPYPGGVSAKFVPDIYDYAFGKKWICGHNEKDGEEF
jgi:hypothetical protein